MEGAIIGAAAALAGVLVGLIGEAWKSRAAFKREKSWLLIEEDRKRLEELCGVVEDVVEAYRNEWLDALAALEVIDRTKRGRGPSAPVPWARLFTVIDLYAPTLRPAADVLQEEGGRLGGAIAIALAGSPTADHDDPRRDHLIEAHRDFTAAAFQLRSAVVQRATSLSNRASRLAAPLRWRDRLRKPRDPKERRA